MRRLSYSRLASQSELRTYQKRVAALEESAIYPLGSDSFKIDHGKNYFTFFSRLGELDYFVVSENQANKNDEPKVVSVVAGVLRKIYPIKDNPEISTKVWYICDLKVIPSHRGNWIPLKILASFFWYGVRKSWCGYAVNMSPNLPVGKEHLHRSSLLKTMSYFPLIKAGHQTTLIFFSLDKEQIEKALDVLKVHRGQIAYLCLSGIKDIVLQSTGKPLNLWHVQFGPCGVFSQSSPESEIGIVRQEPIEGGTHMFCAPYDDPLVSTLKSEPFNFTPSASASVLGVGVDSDWKFILTSDI
eukprot:TRINITY_DN4272_c0_g1_i2.p1 TRINITY_DN4272_c0_g1~~TRINITY_DN4272_c0_g1_i2.p1  ORF type:complete len:299 (-),score=36.97 TRINITY_DN4272_c0_g1_i2:119-1015(-)